MVLCSRSLQTTMPVAFSHESYLNIFLLDLYWLYKVVNYLYYNMYNQLKWTFENNSFGNKIWREHGRAYYGFTEIRVQTPLRGTRRMRCANVHVIEPPTVLNINTSLYIYLKVRFSLLSKHVSKVKTMGTFKINIITHNINILTCL